jgi:proline iminopeptidase
VLRRIGRAAAFAGLLLVAVLLAVAAVVGVAALIVWPVVFLAAGWVVLGLGVWLAARVTATPTIRRRLAAVTLAVLTLVGGFALLWPTEASPPAALPGVRMVDLPTGARLAYLKLPAAGARRATPVVFVHGGPGVADMRGDAPYLQRLADVGFDVYLYDQVGVGRSTRLADPTGYTRQHAVADLEAFRQAIGAARVDLLGYSWGATLSAAYLARYPDRVGKVVFASPGEMASARYANGPALLDRLTGRQQVAVYRQMLAPRALLAWTLAQVNPRAAHAYAGDAEMDTRFRRLNAAVSPALYCGGSAPPDTADVGFYNNVVLQRPAALQGPDPHPVLRGLDTPALVVKGSCDYLPWSAATDYRDTLPAARMVYLPGAGHQAFAERPDAFFATVTAFLTDQPLPLPAETRRTPPPDYQGPA